MDWVGQFGYRLTFKISQIISDSGLFRDYDHLGTRLERFG